MDIVDIIKEILFGVLIEAIGFLFIIGIFFEVVLGGPVGDMVRVFVSSICG